MFVKPVIEILLLRCFTLFGIVCSLTRGDRLIAKLS